MLCIIHPSFGPRRARLAGDFPAKEGYVESVCRHSAGHEIDMFDTWQLGGGAGGISRAEPARLGIDGDFSTFLYRNFFPSFAFFFNVFVFSCFYFFLKKITTSGTELESSIFYFNNNE